MDLNSYKNRCSHLIGCSYHGLCLLDPSNSYGVACKCFEGWYGRECAYTQKEYEEYYEGHIKLLLIIVVVALLMVCCSVGLLLKFRQMFSSRARVGQPSMRVVREEGLPMPVSYRPVTPN